MRISCKACLRCVLIRIVCRGLKTSIGFCRPLTGFRAKAVSGYVPAFLFFDCLRNREFPTTITIRDLNQPRLPAGTRHLPRHRGTRADAHRSALSPKRWCGSANARTRPPIWSRGITRRTRAAALRLTSIIKAMARFFWFTIEFGLMRGRDGLKVYGSGLLSSFGEIEHAIESPEVQRYPLQLEWVINQAFRDRSLPAAAVHRRLLRPSVQPGGPAGKVDARRQAEQRRARRAGGQRSRPEELPAGGGELIRPGMSPLKGGRPRLRPRTIPRGPKRSGTGVA